jgi:hypothetical protein
MAKWQILWIERRKAVIDAKNKKEAWEKSDDLPEGEIYDIEMVDVRPDLKIKLKRVI